MMGISVLVACIILLNDFACCWRNKSTTMWIGFAKTHQNITPKEKSGGGNMLGELPKIWGFPF